MIELTETGTTEERRDALARKLTADAIGALSYRCTTAIGWAFTNLYVFSPLAVAR